MKIDVRNASMLAFFVVFLVVGFSYWRIPYSEASLPNSLYGWGLVFVLVFAAALRAGFGASFMQAFCAVGLAVPAMVLARVVVETLADPTTHNLWPFEIIIAAGVGFSMSLVGALLGGLLVFALSSAARRYRGT